MAGSSRFVVNVKTASFQADVIEKSRETLVVIDFWAPWCAPCRQLAPVLEKLADEYAGKFVLAKINTDEEQQLAAAFQIQSIPMVVAFLNGQPVDQFMGVLPEADIRKWLDALMPSPAELLLKDAMALEETDPKTAEAKYREALALAPDEPMIKIRIAGLVLRHGRMDECQSILQELEQRGYLEPEAERIKSELDVRLAAAETGGVEEARKAVEAHPADLLLQVRYADALAASSQYRKALETCLAVVTADRDGVGQEAKSTMVKIFDMLGPASELTGEFRRKLATALY